VLAILIVNYCTADATLACVHALRAVHPDDCRIVVLDNGSPAEDVSRLQAAADAHAGAVELILSPTNLGFAAGCNRLIAHVLADTHVDAVLLLNSDTYPDRDFITPMRRLLDPDVHLDMVAARMLRASDDGIDSLGIALFRSTLASNRKDETEILLGPSGGCALLTRRLLEDLSSTHGEWFDESFFCYAEDTDLAVRARWLGYETAYAPNAIVHHARSLSSGGPENDFVLYHGIRNSLWWLVKNAPLRWFLRSLPWFVALHIGIVMRHLRRGRARVVWRLYRDAIKGIGAMRVKRATIRRTRRVSASTFAAWVEPHFYQRDYVRRAWREMFRPNR
jgi:N-acetylglucosaminyl-diphospho-decaprenol L-rhamnosyltransferase